VWCPSHCNIRGNKRADTLAKLGASSKIPCQFALTTKTWLLTQTRANFLHAGRMNYPCPTNPASSLQTYTRLTGPTHERYGGFSATAHLPTHHPTSLQTHVHVGSTSTPHTICYGTVHCWQDSELRCSFLPLVISRPQPSSPHLKTLNHCANSCGKLASAIPLVCDSTTTTTTSQIAVTPLTQTCLSPTSMPSNLNIPRLVCMNGEGRVEKICFTVVSLPFNASMSRYLLD